MTLQVAPLQDCRTWHFLHTQSVGSNLAWHPMGSTASKEMPLFRHAQSTRCWFQCCHRVCDNAGANDRGTGAFTMYMPCCCCQAHSKLSVKLAQPWVHTVEFTDVLSDGPGSDGSCPKQACRKFQLSSRAYHNHIFPAATAD